MASGSTVTQSIPYPLSTDPSNVPGDVEALANKLDSGYAPLTRGLLAALPTSTTPAQNFFWAIDAQQLYFTAAGGNPPIWVQVYPPVALPDLTTYNEALITVNPVSTTCTLDLSQGRAFAVNLTGADSIVFSNVPATSALRISISVSLIQDATGGRTASWPGSVDWGASGAPTLSTGANKEDVVGMWTDNAGSKWVAFVGGLGF